MIKAEIHLFIYVLILSLLISLSSYIKEAQGASSMGDPYFADTGHGGYIAWIWWGNWPQNRDLLKSYVNFLRSYPNYRYNLQTEACMYEILLKEDPNLIKLIKEQIQAGKAEIIEGTYAQPLLAFFSGESNVRQLLYGKRVIKDLLNYDVVTMAEQEYIWHTQLPQILEGMGYKYAVVQTPWTAWGWCPDYPSSKIWWIGLDGSKIEAIPTWPPLPHNYFVFAEIPQALTSVTSYAKNRGWSDVLFAYQPDVVTDRISEWDIKTGKAAGVAVKFSTYKEYFESTPPANEVYFPMDRFEFNQPYGIIINNLLYGKNRIAENNLLNAEKLLSIVEILHGRTSNLIQMEAQIQEAWKLLMLSQHHDIYTCGGSWGATIGDVIAVKGLEYLNKSIQISDRIIEALLTRYLAPLIDTKPKILENFNFYPIVVFNPTAWNRTDIVTYEFTFNQTEAKSIRLFSYDKEVPFQVINSANYDDGSMQRVTIAFIASVPSLGYSVYQLGYTNREIGEPNFVTDISSANQSIENMYYRLTFDPSRGGALTEIYDKELGRNMLDTNNHLGNSYVTGSYSSESLSASVEVIESGPIRAVVRVNGRMPFYGFTFSCNVTLYSQIKRIEFDVTFNLGKSGMRLGSAYNSDSMLKVVFNPDVTEGKYDADMPFGVYETAKSTFYGLNFADYSNASYGLTLINDATIGYYKDTSKGITLSNLLLYGPGSMWPVGSDLYMQGQLGGSIWVSSPHIKYAVYTHNSDWKEGKAPNAAMEYNTPLVATSTLINEYSSLPERLSFLNVDAENIHLSAMYPTENGIVIRIYDTYGRDVTANIRLFSQIEKVSQANLNEEVIRQISLQEGKEFSADVGRWRIETFLLQPQKASLMLVLASTSKMNVTQDERPTVTVNIKDRNDSPIREATVKAYVGNRSYQLTEANAGVYSCTIDLSSLEGNVTIRVVAEKEGYLSTEKVLVINVMMSTALPTYLLTAGVAFAVAIAFATAILILKKMRKSLIRMNLTQ